MKALDAARAALSRKGSPARAKALAESALKKRVRPARAEDKVVFVALHRIAGIRCENVVVEEAQKDDPSQRTLSTIANAWIEWLLRRDPSAPTKIARVLEENDKQIIDSSVLNGMTLKLWGEALLAEMAGREDDSKRLFERALEYGGQFGVESFPTVEWSFVATFWRD
jgi:hypothetical protein